MIVNIRVQGEWRNVSKFHPVDLPERGAHVRVSLDNKGFIRSLEILDQAPPTAGSVRQDAIARSAACARSRLRPMLSASSPRFAKRCAPTTSSPLADRILDWLEQEPPQ